VKTTPIHRCYYAPWISLRNLVEISKKYSLLNASHVYDVFKNTVAILKKLSLPPVVQDFKSNF
jgi:hypothetical protein